MMKALKLLRTGAASALCALILGVLTPPDAAWALKEGDPFPNFAAPEIGGANIDTKSFQKKVILIDFWSIYCSSCLQEMPHIVNLHNKYKDQGLQCLGIDLDVYGPARVKKFIDGLDFKIPYPTIIDAKMQIKAQLGVSMLPTTIVVDTTGVVRLFHVGYKPGFEKELEETVKKLLPAK